MHYRAVSAVVNPVFICTAFILSSQREWADSWPLSTAPGGSRPRGLHFPLERVEVRQHGLDTFVRRNRIRCSHIGCLGLFGHGRDVAGEAFPRHLPRALRARPLGFQRRALQAAAAAASFPWGRRWWQAAFPRGCLDRAGRRWSICRGGGTLAKRWVPLWRWRWG